MTDNLMELNGHKASISYDPELDTFRGEILGLNGGVDFYGSSIGELRREFKASLEVYREVYTELLNRNKDLEKQILRNIVISVDDLYSRAGFERPSMASQLNNEPTQAMNGKERKNPPNKKFVAAISFIHHIHPPHSS